MWQFLILAVLAAGLTSNPGVAASTSATAPKPVSGFSNGQKNWIIAAGATRKESAFTFSEVQSEGNG